jgi:hypothetical protein
MLRVEIENYDPFSADAAVAEHLESEEESEEVVDVP